MAKPGTARLALVCLLVLLGSSYHRVTTEDRPWQKGVEAHRAEQHSAAPTTPLVLAVDEGERRVRRFGVSAPKFILKVDPLNGGSRDLTMGYEDLPPGGVIPLHRHLMADEIVFVHRGSGVVELGGRTRAVREGGTIFIPKDVKITLRNTGKEPLSIAFFFSKPGFETYLREMSALEGENVAPLSEAQLREIRKRHEWHTRYD